VSPVNPAIVDRNRRAVHHALTNTFVAPGTIAAAMGVWEAQFAQQAGFRISLYATAVAAELGLNDVEIRELASNLYASMTMTEDRLPKLPPAMNGHSGATGTHPKLAQVAESATPDPGVAVFTKLVDVMIDRAMRGRPLDDVVESMLVKDVAVSEETSRQRMVWINRGLTDTAAFAARVAPREWRALVNDVYVALCDACGPVDADRALGQAVQFAEQLAEARQFPPRSLI
jgi:hypothetical protein